VFQIGALLNYLKFIYTDSDLIRMKTLIGLILIFCIVACTKPEIITDESSASDIEGGTWLSGCGYSGSYYEIRSSGLSGGQFTQSATAFGASGCASPIIKMDITGTYVLGGRLSETSGSFKIDYTLATFSLTPMDATVVTSYNTGSFCGFNDWALGVSKDVTGLTCNSSSIPSAGDMSYDIFQIYTTSIPSAGIVEGELNFGYYDASHDGTSDAQRPTSLDGTFNYSR